MGFSCFCSVCVTTPKLRILAPGVYFAILILYLSFLASALSDIRLPPSIVVQNSHQMLISRAKRITLECQADGVPLPKLKWFKNGTDMEESFHKLVPYENRLKVILTTSDANNIYQCSASNDHGTVISPPMHLREAFLQVVPQDVGMYNITAGDSLMLPCGQHTSFPSPSYHWNVIGSGEEFHPTTLMQGGRIQIDDNGNLHFAYVEEEDMKSGSLYKCYVFNKFLDESQGGYSARIHVEKRTKVPTKPSLMFQTDSPLVVLEGNNVTLKCFSSGFPMPKVTWREPRDDVKANRRMDVLSSWKLDIISADISREGPYTCDVSNMVGSISKVIHVKVEAAPKFKDANDGPRDMNVTDGDNVTINCNPHAIPQANITWFKDGHPLAELPYNYHLSSNSRKLTIVNVCKSCLHHTSDLTVIQCLSENRHGSLWGTGYINVLERTKIIISPESTVISALTTELSFNCSGVSDDSTLVNILWYKSLYKLFLLKTYSDLTLSLDNKTLNIKPHNASVLRSYEGNYSCLVTNGFSTDIRNFTITVLNEIGMQDVLVKDVEKVGSTFAVAFLLMLLAVLLVMALVCYQNHRCATYLVDEKERQNGNEPEKELERNGFLVYSRPDQKPTQGSHLSLISSGISYGNMSLSEYGDNEASKYEEDGSFIGNYGMEYK